MCCYSAIPAVDMYSFSDADSARQGVVTVVAINEAVSDDNW